MQVTLALHPHPHPHLTLALTLTLTLTPTPTLTLAVQVTGSALDFKSAAEKLDRALIETRIRGVKTNIPFIRNVLKHPQATTRTPAHACSHRFTHPCTPSHPPPPLL